jgi:hypothetical protein
MRVDKTLWISLLGATALFAQGAAPEAARQLSARDLFYAPAAPAARRAAAPVAKQSVSKNAGAATHPAVEPLPGSPSVDRAVSSPVSPGGAQVIRASYSTKPLGLRYSILRNGAEGDYREVAPDTVFRSGDRIRVAVEVNDPGYLYIAVKGASGTWRVLFPTADIDGGNNRVENGRQFIIPSAPGRFAFDQQPGEERIFIVLSRQPEPSLEKLIYSLGSQSVSPTSAPAAPSEPAKTLYASASFGDRLVDRLHSEVYARDLVFEKVDDATPGDKKENAVYVLNRTGSPDSRLVADVVLKHQ